MPIMPVIPKDYALAILCKGLLTCEQVLDLFKADRGVLILAEADGVKGVLRAMQVRCGPIDLQVNLNHGPGTLAVLRKHDAGYILTHWHLHFEPHTPPPLDPGPLGFWDYKNHRWSRSHMGD